jgi:hypothetical protein
LLVTATHVPLGLQVLNRGIVFIDLAVAQIAGLGVVLGDSLGFEPQGAAVQDRGARLRARRRTASQLDRAALAGRSGSGDRRDVHPCGQRRDPAACRQTRMDPST